MENGCAHGAVRVRLAAQRPGCCRSRTIPAAAAAAAAAGFDWLIPGCACDAVLRGGVCRLGRLVLLVPLALLLGLLFVIHLELRGPLNRPD